MTSFRPVDEDARARARDDHASSLVLEAGAGTGKTTLLVDRIESLLRRGDATLQEIAAVTFTENAATTMKLRLRERLERAQTDPAAGEAERRRAAAALDVLEQAQVSTIHALAAAMLSERPLESDVLPGFRVAEEAETDLLFGEAWDEWLAERLVQGDEVLLEALDAQIPLEGEGSYGERSSLRGLARALVEQRELTPLVAEGEPDHEAWARELLEKGARAAALAAAVKPGDTLGGWLQVFVDYARETSGLSGRARRKHVARLGPVAKNVQRNFGFRPRWPSDEALAEGRALVAWAKDAADAWAAALAAERHARLVGALRSVGELYAGRKRQKGVLDFLDLLLKARDALRDRASLRDYFRRRFRFLIIDEFQDTDPLQVEIAELLAGGEPGRLVVVGDAKQSIYRFRRAEVSQFRRLAERAAATPGHVVLQLAQNFRSRPAILRFANRVFGELIQASETGEQPGYEPIAASPGLAEGPAVVALRFAAPFAQDAELLQAEAEALARWLVSAAGGRYELRDPDTQRLRPSRAGDVMVLARRLTQLRFLEEALERAGLRFAVEGGRSFFDRQEVHETLAVLRALEDPSDRVALVAALRSSFFGVSDRDIAHYHLASGWLGFGAIDDSLPGGRALAPALALLQELHGLRTRVSVPALLERLFERTRVLAALTGTRRGEAQVANLQKTMALARQAVELGVLTTRGFARFLEERLTSGGEEPDLPATRPGDPETIRVLSIHKAKGLEAPIVVLFDSADDLIVRPTSIALYQERRIAVGFRRECQPPGWEALKAAEEGRVRAEGRRLLYVACTRARDWLVVPCPPRDARTGDFWRELSARLPDASDQDVLVVDADTLPVRERESARADLKALAAAEGGDALAAGWDAERRAVIESAAVRVPRPVPALVVASRGAPQWAFSPGAKGGRDFGSLVHRLLEWTPFDDASPAGLQAMAEALAPSLGLEPEAAERAADSASRALALPVMTRARRSLRIWRELRLWFPEGDELVEGVVDLVFEEEGELVVVDYKTDSIAPEQALEQAAHHAPQLQLYGRGLVQATGMKLRERIVLFTTTSQAIQV